MNDWIKDNLFAVLAVVLTVGGFLMTQYVKSVVDDELSTRGIPSSEKIVAIEGDVEENKNDIKTIEDRWNRLVDAIAAED